jgi:hypothetical protein
MTDMATAVKAADKPKLVTEERKEPEVERVLLNDAGQGWRNVLVRMPAGATQDDLRSPKIWKKAQLSRHTALMKLDHLFILAFDESWFARAVVTHASSTEAHLAIEKVGTFKEQGSSFYQDGTLEVFWDGAAYSVRRIADGVRIIVEGFTTEQQAIAALRNWYPKKAG